MDGDGNGAARCDVGAYEVGAFPVTAITYTYDPLYRLTAANYNNGAYFRYAYDAVGNRLTQTICLGTPACTPVNSTYAYDESNRLISVNGTAYM